jgi:hypothetical protein
MNTLTISPDAEYVPFEYLTSRFTLSRTALERLLEDCPEIHEINLTRPGRAFGRRLVHWPSFQAFMQSRRVPKKEALAA